ncbi:MAG: helix-turn-helix transcriptional regulator [Terracidiphilus sp.]
MWKSLWPSVEISRWSTVFWSAMGNFGKDLRLERESRGIALEDITAATKISQRHLVALEEERFRLLPGGILSKGIVRGYASAVGLDQSDWTERFLRAYYASGQVLDDDRDWVEFASNVGKARVQRSGAWENRLHWIGAALLLLAGIACICMAVRYLGVRAGWWKTMLPMRMAPVHSMLARLGIVKLYQRL